MYPSCASQRGWSRKIHRPITIWLKRCSKRAKLREAISELQSVVQLQPDFRGGAERTGFVAATFWECEWRGGCFSAGGAAATGKS